MSKNKTMLIVFGLAILVLLIVSCICIIDRFSMKFTLCCVLEVEPEDFLDVYDQNLMKSSLADKDVFHSIESLKTVPNFINAKLNIEVSEDELLLFVFGAPLNTTYKILIWDYIVHHDKKHFYIEFDYLPYTGKTYVYKFKYNPRILIL